MDMTPEQQAAMQEKLKNMSPEELKEFQKQQCIFCQMVAGKIQVKKIYEDDLCFAILDINPANPGHILLLPKEHYPIMPIIPENEIGHLFIVARELSHALLRALGVEGTNILVANGAAAGQRAQHFMLHIIPRMEGDNVNLQLPRKEIDENEMQEIRKLVVAAVSQATGVKEPVQGGVVHIGEVPMKAPVEKPMVEEKPKPAEEAAKEAVKESVVEEKEGSAAEKKEGEKPPEPAPKKEIPKEENKLEDEKLKDENKPDKKKPVPTLDAISKLIAGKK